MSIRTSDKPNVILVLTDDQGYGDLGCTGNPWIQTPNLDAFHSQGVRFTDFHVQPLCTPTRGSLMTGRRPIRNGAWATCWGRSQLRRDEMTMADVFAANGYRTAQFGKWHLGDNYPYRPFDRGFETVIGHKGGGVGQSPDFWGNNYFDDTYFHNGRPVTHEGYCTDVWFEGALEFVEDPTRAGEPFFAYIATNAPHFPYLVAEKYRKPYEGNSDIPSPDFYGMIANIDENFGRLRAKLAALGIEDNTILIFMTDNGSSGGTMVDEQSFVTNGFNAGMRGKKGSYYDGGHRVPCFVRWPAGGLTGGRDIGEMAMGIDLLPTLIDLCGLTPPRPAQFDGQSVARLLRGQCTELPNERLEFLQCRQSTTPPEKWTNAVISRRWRLIGGEELYDIKADPDQRRDISAEHPDVVARLRKAHERWWDEVSPHLEDYCPITIGDDRENPTRLDSMDVMGDVVWWQSHIVQAKKAAGRWAVDVAQEGRYRFRLRRWPDELDLPIDEVISPEEAQRIVVPDPATVCVAVTPNRATLTLFGKTHQKSVATGDHEVVFDIPVVQNGITHLEALFHDPYGKTCGAYYVYIQREAMP